MESNFVEASKSLHQNNPKYGMASEYERKNSMKYLLTLPVAVSCSKSEFGSTSLLDHGTGKGGLVQSLRKRIEDNFKIDGYDPAVPEFSNKPTDKYDIVTSVDVLEHIGISEIDSILNEISEVTEKFFFFCIDLLPASKKTKDNRNAHFLVAPSDWWIQKIKQQFRIISFVEVGDVDDGSKYPMHLFGCASNSMKHYVEMNHFLSKVKAANMKWIFVRELGHAILEKY